MLLLGLLISEDVGWQSVCSNSSRGGLQSTGGILFTQFIFIIIIVINVIIVIIIMIIKTSVLDELRAFLFVASIFTFFYYSQVTALGSLLLSYIYHQFH